MIDIREHILGVSQYKPVTVLSVFINHIEQIRASSNILEKTAHVIAILIPIISLIETVVRYSIKSRIRHAIVHINSNGEYLRNLSNDLKANKDVVAAAVSGNVQALLYASPTLLDDVAFMVTVVSQNGLALQYASYILQDNPAVVHAAVSQNGLALQYASYILRNDPDVVRAAVSQNGLALQYTSNILQNNPDVVRAAVSENVRALIYADQHLLDDVAFMVTVVSQNGLALEYSTLQNNPDVAIAAVMQNRAAIRWVPNALIESYIPIDNDQIRTKPTLLALIPQGLITYETVVCADLGNNPLLLQFVPESILVSDQVNNKLIWTALRTNPAVIKFIPKGLITHEMALVAVESDPLLLHFVPAEILIADQEKNTLIYLALSKNPKTINLIYPQSLITDSMLYYVIEKHSNHGREARINLISALMPFTQLFCNGRINKETNGLYWANPLAKFFNIYKKFILSAIDYGVELFIASEALRNDPEVVLAAIAKDPSALTYASDTLRDDDSIVAAAVAKDPSTIRYASQRIFMAARNKDPSIINHLVGVI
jgi:hypothetical protein